HAQQLVRPLMLALSVLGGLALGVWLSLPSTVVAGRGDTWASLGARCGLSGAEVRRANPGVALRPGAAVRLPVPRWRCYLRAWGVERALARILATPTPRAARRIAATPAPSGPVERRDLAEQAFARINAERQARGLPPLAWDEALYRLALARARDMASRGYVGHHDPESGEPLLPCGVCAEVISVATDPVANWKTSPGHWGALMSPERSAGAVAVLRYTGRLRGTSNPLTGQTFSVSQIDVGLLR
ncbi:CAP domain-containing protein, partial [Thermoflexus sp.]|uniref:CAP domain-containing protein n=1 Tax=Thermoflexus sp. TaxID=1969742 RepID=UPI002ADE66FE